MNLSFAPLLLLLLFSALPSVGQKVGLVLSGGGAKGLAHIGVLKALEENEIPIDYVLGTSMGGVVGGCYAAGFSADEIEAIMLSSKFQDWVNGKFNKNYNYYFNKSPNDASWFKLKLSLDSTFNANLNTSLATDLFLNFAMAEKLGQQSAVAGYDFDSLFVPYRAVAADIFTQSEIVIREGGLNNAVRATMSVPFFYQPVRVDGKYLFDGGIYNNFPVDVAKKEFNPEIIIGVNVSSKIFEEYPYEEDDDLVSQSLFFMLLDKSEPSSLDENGFYIEPNLQGYSALDFYKAKSMIDSGYVAGLRAVEAIKEKVKRRADCESLAQRRNHFNAKIKPYIFRNIKFYGFTKKQQAYIKKIFDFEENKDFYLNDIKKGYFRLTSEEYFRGIYPSIVYNDALQAYEFELHNRPANNLNLNVGGALATRNVSEFFLGLNHYHFNQFLTKTGINAYVGTFYKSIEIKSRLNVPGKHQFYIEPHMVINEWDFLNVSDLLIEESSPTVISQIDRKFGINLGFPLGSKYKMTFNGSLINNEDRFSNRNTFISTDTLDLIELDGQRFEFNISSNTLNRKQYASKGKAFDFSLNYYHLDEEYLPGNTSSVGSIEHEHRWFSIKAKLEQYFNVGNYSYGYYLSGVASNQPFFSNFMGSIINSPAFYPLQDSKTIFLQKLRAHNFIGGGIRNVFSMRKNFDLRVEGYFFKALNSIVSNDEMLATYSEFDEGLFFIGTVSGVLHSPVGPISLSLNYYDDPETKFGVLLNIGYLLFNKRSIE